MHTDYMPQPHSVPLLHCSLILFSDSASVVLIPMEAIQVTEANWFDDFDFNSQLEIIQELQEDNQPQFIVSPDQQVAESKLLDEPYVSIINKLNSTVYSGPTIGDIESALSVTNAICNISNPL